MPTNSNHHHMIGINNFLNNAFDEYAREYGEFFQEAISAFDTKIDTMKREIYLTTLAEKGPQGGATTQNHNATLMTELGDPLVTGTFTSRVEGF